MKTYVNVEMILIYKPNKILNICEKNILTSKRIVVINDIRAALISNNPYLLSI